LLSRYPPAPDDACLQVGDDGVDLVGGQLARRWLQVIRCTAQWPSVAGIDRICAVLGSRHSPASTASTDRRFEGPVVKSRRPQVCADRKIIICTIAICERTVAISASRRFPGPQTSAYLLVILCPQGARRNRYNANQAKRSSQHGGRPR